jgi:CO/xanthine dehydrogenase Mo-binding subunit/aerobic-type carbon monoxide dehydrogenase small subunit (CoxS/CutS family)
MDSVRITVNGVEHSVEDHSKTLISFLRDQLGLTGTKNGCGGKGHCGACMVIVNGEAKRSCVVKLTKLDGAVIETIENLALGEELHPIQQTFIKAEAVQCGFCTPGMIMASKALLDKTLDPTDDQIKLALKNNLCRCTGYVSIIKAVKLAAVMLKGQDTTKPQEKDDEHVIRKDAAGKVKGTALYADDLREENLLYGKLLLSEYPHAQILSIDTSEAKAMDGVAAVLTAKDIPGRKVFGLHLPHQPVMAEDKVKYLGDSVAVVFAETVAIAEEAVKKINVEYKPLPGVFSPIEGMKEDAPKIHDQCNGLAHWKVRKGDVEKAFASADIIIEDEYYTPMVEHAYLEPESVLVRIHEDGSLVVYTGSQSSFAMQDMIAKSLGVEPDRVRVILTTTGGAFGGKEEPVMHIHAALGAMVTGRPIKMTLTREESIRMSTKRHAAYIHMRHGATKDGKLVAFESRVITDVGAYASVSGAVVFRMAVVASGPYEIPHVKTDAHGIYTNNNPGGAFRGFGSTQVAFAAELQMDKLARALKMDPIDFRLKNALKPGAETITGQVLTDGVGFVETLHAVREAMKSIHYTPTAGKKIGIGVAGSYKNVGIGTGKVDGAGATLELVENGRLLLKFGATENGQGSDTAMAIIAARATGVNYDAIDILSSDTANTPDGGVTTASRQTYVTGNAVLHTATIFKEKLLSFAAQVMNIEAVDLDIRENAVIAKDGNAILSLSEIYEKAAKKGIKLEVFHYYDPPETFPLRESADHESGVDLKQYDIHYAYCFGSQVAVVEVDESSGEVKVLKMIAAQDAGNSIYKKSVHGQIEGAVMMGAGYALQEEFLQDEGQIVTGNLLKLKVPFIKHSFDIETLVIEKPQLSGPFGAKGMGEVPVNPAAPAIINAIYDAVGVRINSLPATKDKVLAALKK